MLKLIFRFYLTVLSFTAHETPFKLSLTISAKLSAIEIAWFNLRTPNGGYILLTDEEPRIPYQKYQLTEIEQPPHDVYNEDNSTTKFYASTENLAWTYGRNNKSVLHWLQPTETNGWSTTNVIFDNKLLTRINASTNCYGYWAVYIDKSLKPITSTCIRTYATWMNDHKDIIKRFKFRDLLILGSHDSGSYRANFNSTKNETLVTKYALTQVVFGFYCF